MQQISRGHFLRMTSVEHYFDDGETKAKWAFQQKGPKNERRVFVALMVGEEPRYRTNQNALDVREVLCEMGLVENRKALDILEKMETLETTSEMRSHMKELREALETASDKEFNK